MIFCEFLEDVGPDEVDEVIDLLAAVGVLIAEGVEDDAAVDVDVLAEGVVLKGVSSVDDRRGDVLFLLPGLLLKKGLVILEVLKGGLDPEVDLVLE